MSDAHEMQRWKRWLLAIRPATLTAAIVPVLVGCGYAFARGTVRPVVVLLAAVISALVQVGTNLANDVFDARLGADTEDRLGPKRALQLGLLTADDMKRGMVVAFGLSVLLGLLLSFVSSPWVIAIGVASVASGILYTAGPFPLSYHGLGDVFVFVFFGLVAVCGTVFIQMGTVPIGSLWVAIPIGCLSTAVLVVNHIRDEHTDRVASKRTLVVRYGSTFGRWQYTILLAAAFALPVLLVASGSFRLPALFPCALLPVAVGLVRSIWTFTGKDLNRVLVRTAQYLLWFGVLWAFGIAGA